MMSETNLRPTRDAASTDVLSDLLSTIRIDGSVLSELRCGGDWGIDMETGDGIPFYYVTEGECWLIGDQEPTRLSQGDIVVAMHWPPHALASSLEEPLQTARELVTLNEMTFWTSGTLDKPNILHAGANEKDVTILSGIFSLKGRGAKMLIDQLPPIMHLTAEELYLAPQLRMALDFIHQESLVTRPGYIAVASRLMDLLFIQLLRSAISQPNISIGLLAGLVDPNISRSLAAIYSSPATRWTLASLSREAGMSRTAFAERFRSVIGTTPIQYLARWRMTIAEDLLARSNLTVDQIRSELGYGSSFVFARAFRAHSGASPREYRLTRRSTASV